jgi:hypothetical protein
MGGGSYFWLTPQGTLALGVAHNPEYGKMAADSIAKEVEERNLIPAAANPQDTATSAAQAAPAANEEGTV